MLLRRRSPAEALEHLEALVGDDASPELLKDDERLERLRIRLLGS